MTLLSKLDPVRKDTKLYFPHLDALRGIAILMVVAFHAYTFGSTAPDQLPLLRFLSALSHGVPLFFVLSGFLISMIVFDDRAPFRWNRYAMRRFAKIAPPFVLSLVVYGLQDLHRHAGASLTAQFLANLATVPNFLFHFKPINPVSWSLFVEVHFYIALPLVFLGWKTVNRKNADLLTILTFAVVPIALRFHTWSSPVGSIHERFFIINRFPCAMDYFAWGIAFSTILRRYGQTARFQQWARRLSMAGLLLLPVFVALFAALLTIFNMDSIQERAGTAEITHFFICLTSFLLLFSAVTTVPNRLVDNKALRYIGLVSYEWFLFHVAIIPWLRYHLGHVLRLPIAADPVHGWTLFNSLSFFSITSASAIVSFIVSAAIYHYFSQPLLMRLRK